MFSSFLAILAIGAAVSATPTPTIEKRASCTITAYTDFASVSSCSTVTIEALTVPSGATATMSPAASATVELQGDITFAYTDSDGPLLTFEGTDITFVGNGYTIDGNGADYWDGEGTDGGVAKPHPLLKFDGSGTYSDFTVLNTPAQAISVGGSSLTFDSITVDDSAGDTDDLGANTDGFDVSADDITIKNCVVKNQDDCLAINDGTNIVFEDNTCSGGHGMSIGSIASDKTVSSVTISGNTVTDSMYGIRIKADSDATDASVSGVTYSGNTISGITYYGVLLTQSYPDNFGTPGTGCLFSDINFTGDETSITVESGAYRLAIDCGDCTGTWDFDELYITGGDAGTIDSDDATISGGTY